ncbi:MAG: response regulator [Chloroflexota bacterium]|jgi:CheY-like chemotaxis protein
MSYALVIDDNRQTADAMVMMLKLWDLQARAALSPATAMSILEAETPKVIFLDINMPGVDGFEVLGYLKREPRLMGVPVIIVTSDDQPETSRRALSGGAAAVVIKPAMPDLLESALKMAGVL